MNKVIKVNENDLKKVIELATLAGRYDELDRQKAFISPTRIFARRRILEAQIEKLLRPSKKVEQEETVVNLRINLSQLDQLKGVSVAELLSSKEDVVETKSERLSDILNSFALFEKEPVVRQYMLK